MTESLSRRLAEFAAGLRFGDLPETVADKARACLLHNTTAALLGSETPAGRASADFSLSEGGTRSGARLLAYGHRVTLGAAAFSNCVLMNVTNQFDSYRMLTHPGPVIIPAALAVADSVGAGGDELLTALVAGYEVECRIAHQFIPTTQARGFRSSPVYGILGATVAAARLLGYTAERLHAALALATVAAAGLGEGSRAGTREQHFQEPLAARNAVQAALYARTVERVSDGCLDGDAGFLNAFTGDKDGMVTHAFTGADRASKTSIVEGLGDDYLMLDVTMKPYPTTGYGNPVIELATRMRRERDFTHRDVAGARLHLNWLETSYPSPAFPRQALWERRYGTLYYVLALVLVQGGYPMFGQWFEQGLGKGGAGEREPDHDAMGLMSRIEIEGTRDRPFFAPRLSIDLGGGGVVEDELTGDELKWDLEEEIRRMSPVAEAPAIGVDRYRSLVEVVRALGSGASVDDLLEVCRVPVPVED